MSQIHQQSKLSEHPLLDAEVLQVHAPPFVSKETNSSQAIGPAFSRVQRRRSFIKKVYSVVFSYFGHHITLYVDSLIQKFKKNYFIFCRRGEIALQSRYLTEIQPIVLKCHQRQRTSAFQKIWTSLPCRSFVSLVTCTQHSAMSAGLL